MSTSEMLNEEGNVESEVEISNVFIAKGCEKRTHVLDWSWHLNRVIYASAGDICVAVVEGHSQIELTKATHTHPITYLRVFRWGENIGEVSCDFLTSGDSGGITCLHKITLEEDVPKLRCITKYQSESKRAITCCSGYVMKNSGCDATVMFAFSPFIGQIDVSHGTIVNDDYTECKKFKITVKPSFTLCMEIFRFQEILVLAVGTSNSSIELFGISHSGEDFESLITLRGHSNWVTDLSVKHFKDKSLLLASSGQDNTIRLWRFTLYDSKKDQNNEIFSSSVELEALLSGHEDWVVSVHWHPTRMQLLSVSADKSLIIWEEVQDSGGIWLEKARVGEIGGQASGYNGGCFSSNGRVIMASSYFGGFYAWSSDEEKPDTWKPLAVFGGHSMGVLDLSWDPSGTYLLSCSLDQTTRCFTPCLKEDTLKLPVLKYMDTILIVLPRLRRRSCYVSGAEEKILRVFRAPRLFAESLAIISGCSFKKLFPNESCLAGGGAIMPALGLSNKETEKASFLPFTEDAEKNKNIFITPTVLEEVPTEDRLMQSTLWPEVQKLYGHGFEIFAVACNHTGTQIASSCKASQNEHAVVLLWDTKLWKKVASLVAHHLTVVQLAFSNNDHMLASVSRDRTFSIFLQSPKNNTDWNLLYRSKEQNDVHSRIIWSCSWSGDDRYLATCSRDKKLALWEVNEDKLEVLLKLVCKRSAAVTAVDFCSSWKMSGHLIAIGLESGIIEIFHLLNDELRCLICLNQSMAHSQTVKKLKFRPQSGPWLSSWLSSSSKENSYELASAGLDNAVKVYRLKFKLPL